MHGNHVKVKKTQAKCMAAKPQVKKTQAKCSVATSTLKKTHAKCMAAKPTMKKTASATAEMLGAAGPLHHKAINPPRCFSVSSLLTLFVVTPTRQRLRVQWPGRRGPGGILLHVHTSRSVLDRVLWFFCALAPSRSVGASQRGTKCDGCSSNARATLEAVAYTRTNSPRWGAPARGSVS